jgi:uncharacterized protein YecT (DUF1311 family)
MKYTALLLMFWVSTAGADLHAATRHCASTTDNSQAYTACLGAQAEALDRKVNSAYRKVLTSSTPDAKRKAQREQNAWRSARERECRRRTNDVQGTGAGIAFAMCLIEHSSDRLKLLSGT